MTVAFEIKKADARSPLEQSLLGACVARTAGESDTLGARRGSALEWLRTNGLVLPGDEAWRFTPWKALAEETLQLAPRGLSDASSTHHPPELKPLGQNPVLWIVDGVAMSDAEPVRGVRLLPLSEALRSELLLCERIGELAELENGFVAANLAGFADGWCVVVEPGAVVEQAIELRIVQTGRAGATLSLPRIYVVAGAGSSLRLVERHLSNSRQVTLSSIVTEVLIGRAAKVEHARWVDHGPRSWSIATTAVRVEDDAEYHSWSATARGRFVRHDLSVRLSGERASTTLDGLYYARADEVVAQHTRVWHERPAGQTKECYRGVIEDRGRGVFDGIIHVRRGAQKTDARQENRNLLLGPQAVVNTKPHLEIDADDVACSHGATVGQLDETQLFYLRARGIGEAQAKDVLTWAFAKEIVDRCPIPELEASVVERLGIPGSDAMDVGLEGSR